MKSGLCIYFATEGIKPNSGCSNCPKILQENCNERGVVKAEAFLLLQKGAEALASARKAVRRLATRLGTELFSYALLSAGITIAAALPADTRSLSVEAAIRAAKKPREAKKAKVEPPVESIKPEVGMTTITGPVEGKIVEVIHNAPKEEGSPEAENKVN